MDCICSSSGKIKRESGHGVILKCTECSFCCPQYDEGSGLYWYKGNQYKYIKNKFLMIK